MSRSTLEIADIFRDHGPAWREAMRGHLSYDQLKVMSAIEACRTADLGGYVARCANPACGHTTIAYCKRPFAGPEQVLSYLARYTHRVAISNQRLVKADGASVTFTFKDYRIEGPGRYKTMTVTPAEFMRRFLLHVLPKGFHRIRHYGLLASGQSKADRLARARELIAAAPPALQHRRPEPPLVDAAGQPVEPVARPCPCCGAAMEIIERFEAGRMPRHRTSPPPATPIGIDTS